MHESRTESSDPGGAESAVPIPAPGSSGELTFLDRLEAFRDLIRHGHSLLGEVVTYCRQAEAAVNDLAADKQDLDRIRTELEQARQRADEEAAGARQAMTELEGQRRELAAMRAELVQARTAMQAYQTDQAQSAEALEASLRDARKQQARLEDELRRVRAQSVSSRTLDARLAQLTQMESKLHLAEHELVATRHALEEERGRRDRAIALIKPKAAAAGGAKP